MKKTPLRLSHSSKDMYLSCPKKWKFKYIDKFRSPRISSPLFFGNALDEAFSRLLLEKKKVLTPEETVLLSKTAEEVFYDNMLEIQHNRQTVSLPKNVNCDYYTSDFEPLLLSTTQLELLSEFAPDIENFIEFHTDCKAYFKAKKKLHSNDMQVYNYMSWLSMVDKGYLMVEAYRTEIMPQIHEVYDIQKTITITNEYGDSITGKIDFTASFVDEPDQKYICDNKTSKELYKEDSVLLSDQLATYCEAEGTRHAAYVVIGKKVYKRTPHIHTQVIRNIIPEQTFVNTFDNFEKICYSIDAGKFEKNEDNCYAFGRPCEYIKYCKYGKFDGLIKLTEEKKNVEKEEL
jgi:hypothetical protein